MPTQVAPAPQTDLPVLPVAPVRPRKAVVGQQPVPPAALAWRRSQPDKPEHPTQPQAGAQRCQRGSAGSRGPKPAGADHGRDRCRCNSADQAPGRPVSDLNLLHEQKLRFLLPAPLAFALSQSTLPVLPACHSHNPSTACMHRSGTCAFVALIASSSKAAQHVLSASRADQAGGWRCRLCAMPPLMAPLCMCCWPVQPQPGCPGCLVQQQQGAPPHPWTPQAPAPGPTRSPILALSAVA